MAGILILYAGGTIGMQPSPAGLANRPGVMRAALAELLPAAPAWELLEYAPLIDSSDATPADWWRIALDLTARRDRFDGFVVLHGTDTLAYTAAALAFLLPGFGKPVAVTGAMRSLFEPGSDAPANLELALQVAGRSALAGVAVAFAGRVWRGGRVRKADSLRPDAFVAPNDAPLFADGCWADAPPVPSRFVPPAMPARMPRVVLLWLAPGATVEAAAAVLADPQVDGVVLACYGTGNAPASPALAEALAQAVARDAVVVSVTQAWRGGVAPGVYAASSMLAQAGVVPGGDMTPEAAVAKLTVLLAHEADRQQVRRGMTANLAGEIG